MVQPKIYFLNKTTASRAYIHRCLRPGYRAAADALKVIRNTAISLSAVALAVTLAVLTFFAYLFTDEAAGCCRDHALLWCEKGGDAALSDGWSKHYLIYSHFNGILAGTGYAERVIKTA